MKLFNIFNKKIVAGCGHETLEKDKITAFGTSCETKIRIVDGKSDYCHRCLEKMAIRCAWCGEVIFIGDPITLYSPTPKNKNHEMPEHAVLHNKEYNSYVGCLRSNCADTGGDRAGFWYPPGKVYCVPTLYEMCLQNIQNGGDGVICVGDLSDPKEAVRGL